MSIGPGVRETGFQFWLHLYKLYGFHKMKTVTVATSIGWCGNEMRIFSLEHNTWHIMSSVSLKGRMGYTLYPIFKK